MLSISIIGVGRLGGALGIALDRAGFKIENLIYRGTEPPSNLTELFQSKPAIGLLSDPFVIASEVVLITTQDSEIGCASKRLAGLIDGSPGVFITSGALSSSYIAHLRESGCRVGSFHPLVSISDPVLGADRFCGAYFCLEGDVEAVEQARTIVDALEGHSFSIGSDKKPLYHAAAVTACGHLIALIDTAIGMLEKCGLKREAAATVLLPLINSTVENLAGQGVEGALTGPFSRGDIETFERHLDSLKGNTERDEIETYLNLGERSIEIARRLGESNEALNDLQKKVSMAKKDLR